MFRFTSANSKVCGAAIIGLVGLALVAGCAPGEDPQVVKARTVLESLAAEDQEYERYALMIAEGSDSPEALERIISGMGSDNFQTALVAVDALGDEPAAEATEALRQVFLNKGGALKRSAAIQLARLGDAEALDYLKAQLSDPQQLLNLPSVTLVGATDEGGEFLGPILKERLKSDDLGLRNEAYAALGELQSPWATEILLAGLGKEKGEDRQQVIRALGRTGAPEVASKIDRYANTKGLVFVTLEALGELGNPESLKAVKPMLSNDSAPARTYAAVALWKLGEKGEAIAIVNELIQDPDATVRRMLAEQLASIDDEEARSRLAALAEDGTKEVRVETMRAIAVAPGTEFEGVLVQAASDSEYEVSTLALNLLGQVGRGNVVDQIAPLMDSGNPYVAMSAAQAILSIRSREPAAP
jgi:HEAT repeat protein